MDVVLFIGYLFWFSRNFVDLILVLVCFDYAGRLHCRLVDKNTGFEIFRRRRRRKE